jgi:TPR repeat protein
LAERGYPDAQFNIALCYYSGLGVEKNINEAIKWFVISAKNGVSESKSIINKLHMNIDQTIKCKKMYNAEKICVVCYDSKPQILFSNCGHVCCCANCAIKLEICPMCRERFTENLLL